MSRNFYLGIDIDKINNSYSPTDDTQIMRYMDFCKYLDLLEKKKLFFCSSKYFEDCYEGEMPDSFYYKWSNEHKIGHQSISEKISNIYSTYVSCWNQGEEESFALWKVYTNPNNGVCIKTNVGSLKRALNNDDIKIYTVNYLSSFTDDSYDIELPFYFRNSDPIIHRVKEVCKLKAYSYENEIRAIYIEKSKDPGKIFKVNLEYLMPEIYLSPFSSKWYKDLVKKITLRKKTLKGKVDFFDSGIKIRKCE